MSLNIKLFEFQNINALTCLNNNTIYISSKLIGQDCLKDVLIDESSHLLSGDSSHGDKWQEYAQKSYGYVPAHNSEFDKIKRRLGIPSNIAANIGNITGLQQILTDFHLLQQYRRFSQRTLSNEGHWEVLGNRKIKLRPTPRGSFPVLILYNPVIEKFGSPQNRMLVMEMMEAEMMIIVGNARKKYGSLPSPDGGSINYDGDELVTRGEEKKKEIIEKANRLSSDYHSSAIYRY